MRVVLLCVVFGGCVQVMGPYEGLAPEPKEEEPPSPVSRCASDMVEVQGFCMDRFEAPNREGELPLVMFNLYEAQGWCDARGKRLCYDDEWTLACGGVEGESYPYGGQHVAGQCNDEETWRVYSQSDLNHWPAGTSTSDIESYEELIAAASTTSGLLAAEEIESLYQAEAGGANPGCDSEFAVADLVGNIEEWTLRRDGGDGGEFTGNLKGRYWAESRTCQGNVTNHGNGFRFYEIGFRCCHDVAE